jgi:signal transduction histidine kinase
MKIYENQNRWKIVLIVFGVLMLAITLVYSNFLAQKLKEKENYNSKLFITALNEVLDPKKVNNDFGIVDTIIQNFNLPVVFEGEDGRFEANNFEDIENADSLFCLNKKLEFLKSGRQPLEGTGYARYIYYFNSGLVKYINYYPYVQILLVGLFVGLGYFLFNVSRRAEQNRVWAGMAKETAHQLGTPISAIMAWLEHLKDYQREDEEYQEILTELDKDVNRLDLVADRFSKIGSAPELVSSDIVHRLSEVMAYMQRRAPRRVAFDLTTEGDHDYHAQINEHLFDWVLENLMRNSLDAMSNEGMIKAHIYNEEGDIRIDISDKGKGIPTGKFNTIFKPGYSTKARGWGLGLSLAKRIIEEYHNGKIFVKESKVGEGTTFSIKLPVA